jgi:hypothetical protein
MGYDQKKRQAPLSAAFTDFRRRLCNGTKTPPATSAGLSGQHSRGDTYRQQLDRCTSARMLLAGQRRRVQLLNWRLLYVTLTEVTREVIHGSLLPREESESAGIMALNDLKTPSTPRSGRSRDLSAPRSQRVAVLPAQTSPAAPHT